MSQRERSHRVSRVRSRSSIKYRPQSTAGKCLNLQSIYRRKTSIYTKKFVESEADKMLALDPDLINCKNVLADRKLVPDEQIKLFCNVLFLQGDTGENFDDEYGRKCYLNRTRPLMTKLRFPLAKPHSVVRKLLLPEQSKYTYLCDVHSGLNADFVHQWFKYLALEVGARMEILRASDREHIGAYAWDAIVKPLTRLHKIWLSSEQVQEAFGDFVETEFDRQYSLIDAKPQADGCEACILARIGTHINTVWALHTLVKSRITLDSHARHPSRLRLLRLIDAWIQHYQERYSTDTEVTRLRQRDSSTGLAEELYEIREEIKIEQHRMRRAQRKLLDVRYSGSKKYKKLIKDLDDKALEDNIYDAENDIIDHYAALRATQRASALILAGSLDPEGHQPSAGHTPYPLYRNESKASMSATPQGQPSLNPYAPESHAERAYLESRYSINTFRNNDRALLGQDVAHDDLSAGITRLDLSTQYSPVSPTEMAAFEGRHRGVGPHCSASTVWPVEARGSRVLFRPHESPDVAKLPRSDTSTARRDRPHGSRGEQGNRDEDRMASARSQSHGSKSGKRGHEVEQPRTHHRLTTDTLQVSHNGGIEPDFYYRPQDQMSRYTDIPVIDDGSQRDSSVSRASGLSAASAASEYSAYYQRNGARGCSNRPSNLRFESGLSRPFDEPAAPPREDPFHLERYK